MSCPDTPRYSLGRYAAACRSTIAYSCALLERSSVSCSLILASQVAEFGVYAADQSGTNPISEMYIWRSLAGMVASNIRLDIELFSRGGLEILNLIEERSFNVLAARPALGKFRKMRLVATATLRRFAGRKASA